MTDYTPPGGKAIISFLFKWEARNEAKMNDFSVLNAHQNLSSFSFPLEGASKWCSESSRIFPQRFLETTRHAVQCESLEDAVFVEICDIRDCWSNTSDAKGSGVGRKKDCFQWCLRNPVIVNLRTKLGSAICCHKY